MNTVMRSVLSARHEKRAQRAHLLCSRRIRKGTVYRTGWQPSRALLVMTRNSSQLLVGGMQAKRLCCVGGQGFVIVGVSEKRSLRD